MPRENVFLLVLVGVAVAIVIDQLLQQKRLQKYFLRGCFGLFWRRRFPQVTSNDIRKFLSIFGESFGFSAKQQLYFHPDDTIEDVYRRLYPDGGITPDAMECETFAEDIEKEYGFCLTSMQVSLGDLFFMTRRHS